MNVLKEQVLSYLNYGLNPTVIGFKDDGLYYLFDKLLQGTERSTSSYDPTFTFVHVTLNYLKELSLQSVETAINEELAHDSYPGNTILETIQNEVEVVCVYDDLSFVENKTLAIEIADNLVKKYRKKLHFIYIVEDPLLIEELQGKVPASSSIFDAFIYQEIGKAWSTPELIEVLTQQFKQIIEQDDIEEIKAKSNNHFGIFKRMYQDKVLNVQSIPRYISLLIEDFKKDNLNAFKKVTNHGELTDQEKNIIDAYKKVNFIDDQSITVPVLAEAINSSIVKNKVELDESEHLTGLDLHLLTKSERAIIELLMKTDEVITKEQVADIIWKEKANEKFSSWAIDQRIARLRRKLIDFGFNIDVQTVYGKGYKLVKIK